MRKLRILFLSLSFIFITGLGTAKANDHIDLDWKTIQSPVPLQDFSYSQNGDGFGVGLRGTAVSLKRKNNQYVVEDQTIVYPTYEHSDLKTVTMLGEDAYVFGKHFPYGMMERQLFNGKPSGYAFHFPPADAVRYPNLSFNDSDVSKGAKTVFAVGDKGLMAKIDVANGNRIYTELSSPKGKRWTDNNLLSVFSGASAIWAAGEKGTVLYSKDKGKTWNTVKTGTKEDVHSIYFTNDLNGWISGTKGLLMKTSDGGMTWEKVDLGISSPISNVFFMDGDNGFLTAMDTGVFFTNDGGNNWTKAFEGKGSYRAIDKNALNEVWILQDEETFLATSFFSQAKPGSYLFKDVYGTTPGNTQIAALAKEGILNGFNEYFRPSEVYTRAEAATVLSRLTTLEKKDTRRYSDVKTGDWYERPIRLLSAAGIVNGFEDGSFRPKSAVTLSQFSKMLHDMDVYHGKNAEIKDATAFFDSYRHAAEVKPWAADSLAFAFEQGYLEGLDLRHLKPNDALKRREAAVLIYQYYAK